MDIAIIGWVWLGILVGTIFGFVICSWMTQSKVGDLEAEAIQMRVDYEENPSEMSGSVVVVHEDSKFLDEEE